MFVSDEVDKNDEAGGQLIPLLGAFSTLLNQMQGHQVL